MIKHVIWSSMIDYPKEVAAVLFTGKCNFDCSYCYNKTLKEQQGIDFSKEILPKLLKRKELVNHVIISGGEPTCDEDFEKIIDKLYSSGFTIGIHTNGSNPEIIQRNIEKIEYFGVDIKTSKEKYNDIAGVKVDFEKIDQTINLIIKNNKKYEFRTTLFPKYVNMEDVLTIAKSLKQKGVEKYHLQQFYVVNTAEECKPYSLQEIKEMEEESGKIIKTVLKTK